MRRIKFLTLGLILLMTTFISNGQTKFAKDVHSYSNPEQVLVKHVDLDWNVLFDQKIIKGSATLMVENTTKSNVVVLDTRDLTIEKTEVSRDGKTFANAQFKLGSADKFLGSSLIIDIQPTTKFVRVFYSTSPNASGLQWLLPQQTAGKKQPFMFSQAQAIHARSFIPLQDSPQVRVTYSARVKTPKNLLAVMSADGNSRGLIRKGDYRFNMPHPIPSYLIAIAVGDLNFESLGKRTGVYAEPSVLRKSSSGAVNNSQYQSLGNSDRVSAEPPISRQTNSGAVRNPALDNLPSVYAPPSMVRKPAWELGDTEKMVEATEKIYGKYRWDRYDILILPPSFPFGGMENPMLTFATPTILAGDKSLVSLVAHELAHSWSGNLVTNSTWRDFWLNEGFTTYLERRIIEAVYGENRREMEAMLGKQSLLEELAEMDERDQILHVDLNGRDPDDGFTGVPYEKGALFLRYLEEKFGRDKFDPFVRNYFDSHAFQSITTETFRSYLKTNLLDKYPNIVSEAEVDEWIEKGGLPKTAPSPKSDNFAKAGEKAKEFADGKTISSQEMKRSYTTQEWLHFLKSLSENLTSTQMTELDKLFGFTKSNNSEIAFQWLIMSIKNNYKAADARLENFLTTIGRRKFVRPLFLELVKTPEGVKRAKEIYAKARAGYHPITQTSVDQILEWK